MVAVGVLVLVKGGVEVKVLVDVAGCGMIWIPWMTALSIEAGPKLREITPFTGVMLVKTLSRAMFAPPAVAKMSKFVRTFVPLMAALKRR